MDTGHVVRFASQPHPFLVEARPCPDLECPCAVATLTLSELVPPVSAPRDRLTFTLRVCLRTWHEQGPPPRSLEVASLAREFLAGFPPQRIQELGETFQQTRASQRRLKSLTLSGPRDELVAYAEVIDERGGVREGVTDHAFFFLFEGRDFLVEDHYCANPTCDCQEVYLEFWERLDTIYPQRRIDVRQRLMARFALTGQLREIRFREESASTADHLLRAWCRRASGYFPECRRRYELIKAVGARSFPPPTEPRTVVARIPDIRPEPPDVTGDGALVRRNDPCPCGSGLKFKRCCARRTASGD